MRPHPDIGFTGTRDGMTPHQKATVAKLLLANSPREVHHGHCRGADADLHLLCEALEFYTVSHPPTDPKQMAILDAMEVRPRKPYLQRNRDIVDAADLMVACPKEDTEPPARRGQGTWSTVRYARKTETPTVIVWPDGRTT